ncbi:MAG: hypothetical protein GWP12_01990 [Nitrospirae bacterium]|nr:hypothetical protein [Nitrospirota bacterium]
MAFTVPTGKYRTKASAFAKAFYGQETNSHHGKYISRRYVFLDEIAYNKLIHGVIIIQMKDEKRVLKLLNVHSAKYYTRVVELKGEDCKAMELLI